MQLGEPQRRSAIPVVLRRVGLTYTEPDLGEMGHENASILDQSLLAATGMLHRHLLNAHDKRVEQSVEVAPERISPRASLDGSRQRPS